MNQSVSNGSGVGKLPQSRFEGGGHPPSRATVNTVRNLPALAFVFWVFLLVPGLCGAGLLSHACADDASADCTHEETCAQDPCSMLTIRTSPTELARESELAAVATALLVQLHSLEVSIRSRVAPENHHFHNIPLPAADLPLLI
jgi:hypothetical protein